MSMFRLQRYAKRLKQSLTVHVFIQPFITMLRKVVFFGCTFGYKLKMKVMENRNEPIHPIDDFNKDSLGLTKREYFALELMKATIIGVNSSCVKGEWHGWSNEAFANEGVSLADELLKQLEQ